MHSAFNVVCIIWIPDVINKGLGYPQAAGICSTFEYRARLWSRTGGKFESSLFTLRYLYVCVYGV